VITWANQSDLRIGLIALAITLIALAIIASTAAAASTRAEYVAQVDPICHAAHVKEKAAAHRFKKRAHQLVRRGMDPDHPSAAGIRAVVRFYGLVIRIQRSLNTDIANVAPAPGDETLISRWLQIRSKVPPRLQQFLRTFSEGKQHKARRAISRAFKADFQAYSLMQDFGFKYCA
jgi:hypothetical protein